MFMHLFRYQILQTLRDKGSIFWRAAFPIMLGTFMFFAFGGVTEKELSYTAIPTAVVVNEENEIFENVVDELSQGDEPLMSVTKCTAEEAKELLAEEKVLGIIYVDEDPSLAVADTGVKSSILRAFLDEYRMSAKAVEDIAETSPEKLPGVIEKMKADSTPVTEKHLTDGNDDPYVQYFYNVIAMSLLYSAVAGLTIAIKGCGNMSPLGARSTASPVTNIRMAVVSLAAESVVSFVINFAALLFYVYVLKIKFGVPMGYMMLILFAGLTAGLSFGYVFGSVFRFRKELKYSLMMAVIMTGCFLSGLMAQFMRQVVEENCPIVNRLNLATLISDSFYALNIYGAGERFCTNIVSLFVLSAVMMLVGIIVTRRQSYASL